MSHHQSYVGVICGSETEICDTMQLKGEPVDALKCCVGFNTQFLFFQGENH